MRRIRVTKNFIGFKTLKHYITPDMVAATAIGRRPQVIEILSKKNLGTDLLPKK